MLWAQTRPSLPGLVRIMTTSKSSTPTDSAGLPARCSTSSRVDAHGWTRRASASTRPLALNVMASADMT